MKFSLTAFMILSFIDIANSQDLTKYVDPFVGVKGRGSCVVGPQLPFGSINPSPDTPGGHTDGYNYESKIRGFSQLHVSGTGGSGKYGQFLLSPQIGINFFEEGHDSEKSEEVAEAGYYKVRLNDYNILCEFTPTHHAALYRFTFPKSDDTHLLIDLGHNIPGDIAKRNGVSRGGYADNGYVEIDKENQIIKGWGIYWGGWSGEPFAVYFAMKISKPFSNVGTWKDSTKYENNLFEVIGKKNRVGAFVKYSTEENEQIYVKIAVSMKSINNAVKYLDSEIPAWDFESIKSNAKNLWNKELSKIKIEGASEEEKTIFYTSLYHTMVMPRDRTGDNPKSDNNLPYWDDHYCVWDTWKTNFPLQVLINENMVSSNINAFIERFRQNGKVLDAFIAGNDKMFGFGLGDMRGYLKNQGGDNVDNVIADAYVKGIKGVDWNEAYKILKHQAEEERAETFIESDRGWVPFGTYIYGLDGSRTVEFAYNDFCISQVAKGLGKLDDYKKYLKRSTGWMNLWNPDLTSDGFKGFLNPKYKDGTWVKFDPKSENVEIRNSRVGTRSFYEASSWEYSYFVPHNYNTLIALSGGKEKFVEKLQHAFNNNMINYGNEPSFITPFCFIYAGRPDLTSFWVRKNFENYTLEGYPGDEDSGGMGSWFVFSSMGFFPNAGQDIYLLNGPKFPKVTITRESGEQIIIIADSLSKDNIYIKSVELNGKPLNRAWISHKEISNGATIRFVMASKKSGWATENFPPSLEN